MKAKLHKTGNQYLLRGLSGEVLAITITNGSTEGRKLSKQNCDEIFGVVDVEKIADRHTFGQRNHEWKAYIKGFNKAMELNKDKQFTLEDIKKAMNYMFEQTVVFGNKVSALDVDRFIQSLQQPTEIEVTFNPEEKDSEGCLILKKI